MIRKVEYQPTKAGKDKWSVGTSLGFMTCWEKKLAEALMAREGKSALIEVSETTKDDKTYVNIRKLLTGIDHEGEPTAHDIAPPAEKLSMVVATKEEAFWIGVKEKAEAAIQACNDELRINQLILDGALKHIEEEKQKD